MKRDTAVRMLTTAPSRLKGLGVSRFMRENPLFGLICSHVMGGFNPTTVPPSKPESSRAYGVKKTDSRGLCP